MRTLIALFTATLLGLTSSGAARADAPPFDAPYAPLIRQHYYEQLQKRPLRAFALELALPGLGSYYTGVYVQAACTLALSLSGAALWTAGALRERRALASIGLGTFVGARLYGLVGAPVSARLLNAAYRRQLGIVDEE